MFALSIKQKDATMTTKKITVKESTNTKDNPLQTTIAQLQTALPALKEQLGEKKFEKRIKKVH